MTAALALRRAGRVFVTANAVVLVLWAALRAWDSNAVWWIEFSRYLPYYMFLVPALAALGWSLLLSRWWVAVALASLALLFTVNMGLQWNTGEAGSERLRFMTYNVKAAQAVSRPGGISALALEVIRHDPDVVVMQDADGLLVERSAPGLLEGPPVFGLPYVYAVGQYVIASRLPLRDCQIGQMGFRQESHRFAHCYVEIKGTKVELVTAHFQSPRQGLYAVRHDLVGGAADWKQNFTDRLTQSMKLARALLSNPMPRIVAGDLNADVASPVVRNLLETGLRDAYSDAGRGYGFTYGHAYRLGLAFLRIDHILVSREFGVIQCFVGEGNASQHRPVIADLVLRKAPS